MEGGLSGKKERVLGAESFLRYVSISSFQYCGGNTSRGRTDWKSSVWDVLVELLQCSITIEERVELVISCIKSNSPINSAISSTFRSSSSFCRIVVLDLDPLVRHRRWTYKISHWTGKFELMSVKKSKGCWQCWLGHKHHSHHCALCERPPPSYFDLLLCSIHNLLISCRSKECLHHQIIETGSTITRPVKPQRNRCGSDGGGSSASTIAISSLWRSRWSWLWMFFIGKRSMHHRVGWSLCEQSFWMIDLSKKPQTEAFLWLTFFGVPWGSTSVCSFFFL